jgi:prolyl-tRNA editing enzyme YbaK/EbsC (Cys-tRNA(Pro) deacylase)
MQVHKAWTALEVRFLELNRGKLTTREMAERLGRQEAHVRQALCRLFKRRKEQGRPLTPVKPSRATTLARVGKRLRALHARGLSDPDIGHRLGLSVRVVQCLRVKAGLPSNAYNKVHRAKQRRAQQEVPTSRLASMLAAEAMGWPGHPRSEALVLEALRSHGPLVGTALAGVLGIKWYASSNGHSLGARLRRLLAAGLVVREPAHKGPTGRGKRALWRLASGVVPEATVDEDENGEVVEDVGQGGPEQDEQEEE